METVTGKSHLTLLTHAQRLLATCHHVMTLSQQRNDSGILSHLEILRMIDETCNIYSMIHMSHVAIVFFNVERKSIYRPCCTPLMALPEQSNYMLLIPLWHKSFGKKHPLFHGFYQGHNQIFQNHLYMFLCRLSSSKLNPRGSLDLYFVHILVSKNTNPQLVH